MSRNKYVNNLWYSISRVTKSASQGVTRAEIGNVLEDFKIELLGTISS